MILERTIKITNTLGIHVRPAAQLAETANKYEADIMIIKGSLQANAKSIIELLSLGAPGGTTIMIRASGKDAQAAVEAIHSLFESKFGEE